MRGARLRSRIQPVEIGLADGETVSAISTIVSRDERVAGTQSATDMPRSSRNDDELWPVLLITRNCLRDQQLW